MENQKRLIIAVVLSVVVLLLFQAIQPKNSVNIDEKKTTDNYAVKTVDDKESTGSPEPVIKESNEEAGQPAVNEKTETISAYGTEITVSSEYCGFKSIVITDKDGSKLDLVRKKTPPYNMGFVSPGFETWQLKKENRTITGTAVFNGIQAVRKISVVDKYMITINERIKNISSQTRTIKIEQGWYEGIGSEVQDERDNFKDNRPFVKIGGKVKKDVEKGVYEGTPEWMGVLNRYFVGMVTGIDSVFDTVKVRRESGGRGCSAGGNGDSVFPSIIMEGSVTVEPGESYSHSQGLYAGLKEYSLLSSLGEDIDEIFAFGMFGFLSKLFLNILIWLNAVTGNYGVAIIILTILLQIVIFPLTVKSFKSMKAMKDIQPKINSLRTKYKDDPQRMNQEMMHLYKRNKVNPFGGCLPLLIQFPIFISLFTMLRSAAELRNASFLWINNLSQADSLFASIPLLSRIPLIGGAGPLPFLMGGAMFMQQKFMSGGGEGPQQSLTYMMPIVFTFLFMNFPAGLVLYWLSNSLLTFLVQYSLSKKQG